MRHIPTKNGRVVGARPAGLVSVGHAFWCMLERRAHRRWHERRVAQSAADTERFKFLRDKVCRNDPLSDSETGDLDRIIVGKGFLDPRSLRNEKRWA